MAEAPVCLRDQGIDKDDGGVSRLRRDHGLSNDDGGFGRVQIIHEAYEGSDITTEASGARRKAQVIYNDDGGVGGGR